MMIFLAYQGVIFLYQQILKEIANCQTEKNVRLGIPFYLFLKIETIPSCFP